MNPNTDSERFSNAVAAAMELYGKSVGDSALRLWWSTLRHLDLDVVLRALKDHIQDPERGQWQPKPADIIWQIENRKTSGWVSADEAWSTALQADDEAETVVWTDQSARAFAVARPILGAGDEVGARMAFRESYNRLVREAASQDQEPVYHVSLGHDPQRREHAVHRAAERGLISHETVSRLLPSPTQVTGDLARLAGTVTAHPTAPEDLKERLAGLRSALSSVQEADNRIRETLEVQQKRRASESVAQSNQGVTEWL